MVRIAPVRGKGAKPAGCAIAKNTSIFRGFTSLLCGSGFESKIERFDTLAIRTVQLTRIQDRVSRLVSVFDPKQTLAK
jgi:hypothetical protein